MRSDHIAPAVSARLLLLWYQFFQMPGTANLLPQNNKKIVKTASVILKNLAAAKVDVQKNKKIVPVCLSGTHLSNGKQRMLER